MTAAQRTRFLYALAISSYIALIVLSILWEGWLAPAPNAPPGMWLTIKSVPLLLPLFGLLHGKPYTYAWASMLVLVYLTEGVVLTFIDRAQAISAHSVLTYAVIETALSLMFVVCAPFYARLRAIELESAGKQ